MSHTSVTVIGILNDVKEVTELLNSLNCQSMTDYQLILMVRDKETFDTVVRYKDILRAEDHIIDYVDGDIKELIKKAISYSTGEYIWICESGDRTSYKFLSSMLTIQRNLGVDVIITDYYDTKSSIPYDVREKISKKDVTVYYSTDDLRSRLSTIDRQWMKFFRKSLIDGLESFTYESLSKSIIKKASSVCYYHRRMFTYIGPLTRVHMTNPSVACSWNCKYDDLKRYYLLDHEEKLPITIGICAYNEQYVIESTIRSIFKQKNDSYKVERVIVVSSGSTDDTNSIIDRLSKEFDVIQPIYQEKREGKNSAVNEIMRNAPTEIVILYNADNVFTSEYSLDMLICPFFSPKVGMTGGHPIPMNNTRSISDYTVQLMWSVHHYVAMEVPNMGELIAFRNIDLELPTDMQGDEGIIRSKLESKGYEIVYVPEATIMNRGPTVVSDFLKQRKRVNVGEIKMLNRYGFKHPTHNTRILIFAFFYSLKQIGYKPLKTTAAVVLEYYSRLLARLYSIGKQEDISIWEQIKTTKKI